MGPALALSHSKARSNARLRRLAGLLVLISCEDSRSNPNEAGPAAIATVVLPASPNGDDWTIAGDVGHAAALLPDGTVLIAGGNDDAGAPVATAQIWDPATATAHGTAAMTTPRSGHSMTLLPDGRVLVAGGTDGSGELASLEVFDPATGSFDALSATLATPRRGPKSTAMNDGHVIIQAGAENGVAVTTKELFDSADESVAAAGAMNGVVLASVATDRGDYSPGDHVGVSGAGWQPGETVALLFDETPIEHWPHVVNVVAGADGTIANSDYQLEAHDLGTSFVLTATGMSSGWTAQVVFTDSSVLTYQPTGQQVSNVNAGGVGKSFTQRITAPSGSGTFTATLFVEPTGANPAQASWFTSSPAVLNFSDPSGLVQLPSITVTVPTGVKAGNYTANVRVQPSVTTVDGDTGTAVTVQVVNSPPVADAGGPYTVPENGTLQLAGNGADPNGDAVTFAWDLDGNGSFETPGQNPVFSAVGRDGPGQQLVTLRVCDPQSLCGTSGRTIIIANVPPTATFVSPTAALNEGTSFALAFTAPSDPSAADVAAGFRYAFDCGTGYGPPTPAASVVCATPDSGTLSVGGKVFDKDNGSTEYRASVTVNNVAPSAAFIAPATGREGSPFDLTLTNATDPSTADTSAGFTYAFDCGDGHGFGPFATNSTASCTPADDGAYTVHGAIRDKDGGTSTYDATVVVANVAPTAASLDNNGPINEGSAATISFSGVFDPSSADTAAGLHFAFGCDGVAPVNSTYVGSSPDSSTSCRFDDNGTYTVVARVIDKNDGFNQYSTAVTVNNVAPTAKLVNGGPIDEGGNASVTFTDQFDPSPIDTGAGFHYAFACNGQSLAGANYANSGSASTTFCHFDENGNYTVVAVIFDKDDGATNATTVVVVGEVPPTAVFSNNGPILEGGNVTVTFSDPFDPSNGDTAPGFHYAVACHGESLDGATYEASTNATSFGCHFDDSGIFPVNGRIIEEDGTFTEHTTQVVVLNVPPTAQLGNSGPIDEGGNATVAFTIAFDPSPVDTAAGFHYAFSCDGSPLAGTTYASSGAAAAASCSFDDSGAHRVLGRIFDKDGGYSETNTTVTVNNVAPTASLTNDGPIDEGGAAIISFRDAFDPSHADTAAGFHFAFDCGGNAPVNSTYVGSSADPSASCTFDDNGTFTVAARIIDKDGGFNDYTTTVDVNNVNVTADLVAPETVNEGGNYTISLIDAFDPSPVDTAAGFGYAFDCGDGVYGPVSASPVADCAAADNGTRTVRGRIVDKDGGGTERTAVVTVLNVAPTATLTNDGSVAEGSPAVIRFIEPFDPGPADTAAGFHYAFHCDGTPVTDATYDSSGNSTTTQCVFNEEGDHTVSGRIIDKDGGFTEHTTTVTVTNVAPVITSTSGPNQPVDVGSAVTVTADFTDTSGDTGHTCAVEWGDGQTGAGAVTESGGDGSCSATHAYGAPGSFTVSVSITDDEGATATATLVVNVAAPQQATGGLSFGEGTINLPAGADPAHPWVSGKALFVFAAQGGSGRPFAGVTDLIFLRDGFVFSSSRVETFSVSSNTAVYTGSGHVNGRSGYHYTVTVVGRKSCGRSGADELRLQVMNAAGSVVFDTSPGAPNGEADPISSGFAFVHSF